MSLFHRRTWDSRIRVVGLPESTKGSIAFSRLQTYQSDISTGLSAFASNLFAMRSQRSRVQCSRVSSTVQTLTLACLTQRLEGLQQRLEELSAVHHISCHDQVRCAPLWGKFCHLRFAPHKCLRCCCAATSADQTLVERYVLSHKILHSCLSITGECLHVRLHQL